MASPYVQRIRKINKDKNTTNIVFDPVQLGFPKGNILGMDVSADGTIYAADYYNDVIYKIPANGGGSQATPSATTVYVKGALAGETATTGDTAISGLNDATAPSNVPFPVNVASLSGPKGLCVDYSNNIYAVSAGVEKIKRISSSGRVQTLCGGGAFGVTFSGITGICVDRAGVIYVCDTGVNKIKRVQANGTVAVLAGGGVAGSPFAGMVNGNGNTAAFHTATDVAVDRNGNVYVADSLNYRIRKVDPSGNVTTLAGSVSGFVDGGTSNTSGAVAKFTLPTKLCIDYSEQFLYVLDGPDAYSNYAIRKVSMNGVVNTFWNWKTSAVALGDIAVDRSGFVYYVETFTS
jgi:sugar lactone lactonase YvrE